MGKRVVCMLSGKHIPKDKAVKRFVVRNIVEASAMRDIRDASFYENYVLPKVYYKQYYSIEAAIHHRWCVCVPKKPVATVLLPLASVPSAKTLLVQLVPLAPSQRLLLLEVLVHLVLLLLELHQPLPPLLKLFLRGNLSRVFALLVCLTPGFCREFCAPISVIDF